MIAILISVMVTIFSLMVAFFLAVGNVGTLVESDFMYKAQNNAVLHGLQYGQLAKRAKTLDASDKNKNSLELDAGYLRVDSNSTATTKKNMMVYNITLDDQGKINATVEVK